MIKTGSQTQDQAYMMNPYDFITMQNSLEKPRLSCIDEKPPRDEQDQYNNFIDDFDQNPFAIGASDNDRKSEDDFFDNLEKELNDEVEKPQSLNNIDDGIFNVEPLASIKENLSIIQEEAEPENCVIKRMKKHDSTEKDAS